MAIYDKEKMKQKDIYPTKETSSYADWALFEMGKELEDSGGTALSAGNGIEISEAVVSAKIGDGLEFDENGAIKATGGGTDYTAGDGITISNNEISAKIGDGLQFDENGAIEVTAAPGQYTGVAPIVVDNTNETIEITMDSAPLEDSTNAVTSGGVYLLGQSIQAAEKLITDAIENEVATKATITQLNTVAGYNLYTPDGSTPVDVPVATTTQLATKQDKLTAGTNVQISSSNVISATDTKYTAGTNVQISSSNVISATDTKAGITVTHYGVSPPGADSFQNGDIIEIDLPTINQSVSSASSWSSSLGTAGLSTTGGSCSNTVRVRISNGTQSSKIPVQTDIFMNGTSRVGIGIVYFSTDSDFLNKLNGATTSTDTVFRLTHHAFNGNGLVTATSIQVTKANWLNYVMGCRRYRTA